MHWKGTGGRSRGCSVGFDGIKMYRTVDGFVLFTSSRAMTDILCCMYKQGSGAFFGCNGEVQVVKKEHVVYQAFLKPFLTR